MGLAHRYATPRDYFPSESFDRSKGIALPQHIATALDVSIRLRSEAARVYSCMGLADEPHAHFISILKATRRKLKEDASQEQESKKGGHAADDDVVPLSNGFKALEVDAADEEGPGLTSDQRRKSHGLKTGKSNGLTGTISGGIKSDGRSSLREQLPSEDTDVSDVTEGDDRFRAACFLVDFDKLLYEVQETWKAFKAKRINLLSATMATNACVRSITRLASLMVLAYPHLKSFHHVIAVVFLQRSIRFICKRFPKVSYDKAVDTVSRMTHARVNPPAGLEDLRKRGFRDSEMVLSKLKEYLQDSDKMFVWSRSFLKRCDPPYDIPWWSTTIDEMAGFIDPKLKFRPKKGLFGHAWDEKENLASGIADLRGFVFEDVFPPLSLFANQSLPNIMKTFGETASHFESLMPLPCILRESVETRRGSIALLFSVFALCACMLEVQGDSQVKRTMIATRVSLKKLRDQLKGVTKRRHSSIQQQINVNIGICESYLDDLFRFIDKVSPNNSTRGVDASLTDSGVGENVDNAMLNPWMAGQHLAVSVFLVTIVMGLQTVDCAAQSRVILHLYNALRTIGALREPIPLLDVLFAALSHGEGLFVGVKPRIVLSGLSPSLWAPPRSCFDARLALQGLTGRGLSKVDGQGPDGCAVS